MNIAFGTDPGLKLFSRSISTGEKTFKPLFLNWFLFSPICLFYNISLSSVVKNILL